MATYVVAILYEVRWRKSRRIAFTRAWVRANRATFRFRLLLVRATA
jgi:hypothetical protein